MPDQLTEDGAKLLDQLLDQELPCYAEALQRLAAEDLREP
jgi:hypothetical protein